MKLVNALFSKTPERSWLVAFSVFFAMAVSGFAEAPRAEMSVSSKHLEVGQTTKLRITVSGEGKVETPHEIDVDGLSIQYQGRSSSSSYSFNNGVMNSSRSITDTFVLTPQREGEITIPAQTVKADGKPLTTEPITLDVVAASSGNGNAGAAASGGSAGQSAQSGVGRIAFAELVVPKDRIYVGETVPIVLNFFFNADAQVLQVETQGLTLKSDGFTVKPFRNPDQQRISKDGKNYIEVTFKTAITPVKAGDLTLGGAEMPFTAMIQQKPPQQDDDDNNSPFNGNATIQQMMRQMQSFNNMAMASPQQMTVKSDPVKINVLPLPEAGRPANFSGAVGQFRIADESAEPAAVSIGDPVEVKIGISGYGSFDRIDSPTMAAVSGWKNYPSGGKFKANDDIGFSGTKTFDISVVPLTKQTRTPIFEFSYFDPTAKKYVTLRSREFPLAVSGSAAAPTPTIVTNSQLSPAASANAEKPKNALLPIKAGEAQWGVTFAYWTERPVFWEAQVAPLFALLLFGTLRFRRLRAANVNVQRALAERNERDLLTANLRAAQTASAFYAAAARLLQFDAGVTLGKSALAVSDEEALSARAISAETRESVRQILQRNDELSYAGSGAREESISSDAKSEVLRTIKAYEGAKSNA